MTKRRALTLARMLLLAAWRFVVLMAILGIISQQSASLQLILLPVGILAFLARYAVHCPQRWLRAKMHPELVSQRTARFRTAREAAVLLLRRPANISSLIVAALVFSATIPFAIGQSGLCSRGGVIDVKFGLVQEADALVGPIGQVALVVFRIVAFALLEEFVLRGWLLFPLRKMFGPRTAVAITSFLFAMAHMRISTVRNDLLNGVIFGSAAIFSGSIWVPVTLHVAYNAGVWTWSRFFETFGPGAIKCSTSMPIFFAFITILVYVLWVGQRRPGQPSYRRALSA